LEALIGDGGGGDYEERRLVGYKNPVRTSQETHHVSTTEPRQLMLCEISSFHSGDYEECRLLGCYVMWLIHEPHGVTSQKTAFFKWSINFFF
jgi:hypothetical protein